MHVVCAWMGSYYRVGHGHHDHWEGGGGLHRHHHSIGMIGHSTIVGASTKTGWRIWGSTSGCTEVLPGQVVQCGGRKVGGGKVWGKNLQKK